MRDPTDKMVKSSPARRVGGKKETRLKCRHTTETEIYLAHLYLVELTYAL
jgi:hypothetical protein